MACMTADVYGGEYWNWGVSALEVKGVKKCCLEQALITASGGRVRVCLLGMEKTGIQEEEEERHSSGGRAGAVPERWTGMRNL